MFDFLVPASCLACLACPLSAPCKSKYGVKRLLEGSVRRLSTSIGRYDHIYIYICE